MTDLGNGGKRTLYVVVGIQTTIISAVFGILYSNIIKQIDALKQGQENSLAAQTAAKLDERTNMWVPVIQENRANISLMQQRLTRIESKIEDNSQRLTTQEQK